MPSSPAQFEEAVARQMLEVYAEAERIMVERVRRRLERGIDEPGWAEHKLAEIQALRRDAEEVIANLEAAQREGERRLERVYRAGMANADAELKGLPPRTPALAFGDTHKRSLQMIVADWKAALNGTHFRILRASIDVYREAVAAATSQIVAGTVTRREATQYVLRRFADQGITGFVDRAGRAWSLSSYAEMATRTAAGRAGVTGHMNRLYENGYDLVIVSDSPEECPLCRPWEGRVLSISGRTRGYPSVDEAIGAGMFHPNCTHRFGIYLEGYTKPYTNTENPEGYELRQEQRYMERQIRRWKRREAAAMTEEERRYARQKVREWQGRIRAFVDEHDRKRLYYREQI